MKKPPQSWQRLGTIMERGKGDEFDSSVIGDPCVIWDEILNTYRMFYFAQRHVDGNEENRNAYAVSFSADKVEAGDWIKKGLVTFSNPELIETNGHKAWIVMDALRTNSPARINDQFWMVQTVYCGHNKRIYLAKADSLDGPWNIQEDPIIDLGAEDEFDGYNCDSPTAYWFENENKVLIFYKGYPKKPQPDQHLSPLGSSPATAEMSPDDKVAKKNGKILSPSEDPYHWTSGWLSTPNIFKATDGGWYGFLNGSPSSPIPVEMEPAMREPAPSHGGWMYTQEEWPIKGWKPFDEPLEWINDIPEDARANGEGTSFWKHHILIQPDGTLYLYYHSGSYGQERLFGKKSKLV